MAAVLLEVDVIWYLHKGYLRMCISPDRIQPPAVLGTSAWSFPGEASKSSSTSDDIELLASEVDCRKAITGMRQ